MVFVLVPTGTWYDGQVLRGKMNEENEVGFSLWGGNQGKTEKKCMGEEKVRVCERGES